MGKIANGYQVGKPDLLNRSVTSILMLTSTTGITSCELFIQLKTSVTSFNGLLKLLKQQIL